MKNTILLLLLIFSIGKVYTQNYLPFANENSVWVNTNYYVDWSAGNPIPDLRLSGVVNYCTSDTDTIIDSLSYQKINYCGAQYKGAIRDTAGKVYFIPKDSTNEFLLYDFTVQAGDTLTNIYVEDFYGDYVELHEFIIGYHDVDSVLINNEYRKRISFSGGQWIEGIGNTQGLFLEPWINVSDYVLELHCMSENDTTLYPTFLQGSCKLDVDIDEKENSDVSIYPNPSNNGRFYFSTQRDLSFSNITIINTVGQKVVSIIHKISGGYEINLLDSPKGIYILSVNTNGKISNQKLILN